MHVVRGRQGLWFFMRPCQTTKEYNASRGSYQSSKSVGIQNRRDPSARRVSSKTLYMARKPVGVGLFPFLVRHSAQMDIHIVPHRENQAASGKRGSATSTYPTPKITIKRGTFFFPKSNRTRTGKLALLAHLPYVPCSVNN